MTAAIHTTKDGTASNQTARKSGAAGPCVRAISLALGGLLVGLGVLRATNVFWLIPQDAPQLWVRSGCGWAERAVDAALHAELDRPVFLIPLDQTSEKARSACRRTLAVLDYEGYRWLRYFPERWLCQRFADDAAAHVKEPIGGLRFYAGGEFICDGLCDGAFDRIGRPELQEFTTFIKVGS